MITTSATIGSVKGSARAVAKSVATHHRVRFCAMVMISTLCWVLAALHMISPGEPDRILRRLLALTTVYGYLAFLCVGLVFVVCMLWCEGKGIFNWWRVEEEDLSAIERKHPYLPHARQLLITAILLLSLPLLFWSVIQQAGAAINMLQGHNPLYVYEEARSWQIANDGANLTVAGKVYTDEGTTNIGAGKTVAISLNGSAAAGTDATDGGGEYAITGLTITGGTVITLYIDGATEKAVTVTLGSGSNMTGMHLYQNHLIVRSDSGSVALTNSHLAVADNNGDTDINAIYTMGDSHATLQVRPDKELWVWTGDTYTPGGRVKSHDVEVKGTLTMGTNGLTVTGSLITNAGTFTTSTGVLLASTASSAETLSMGTNATQNLTINNGLVGYWKLDDGTGDKAVDSSGYGNVGTLSSMTTGFGGPSGWTGSTSNKFKFYNPYALIFDGSNDYVTVGTDTRHSPETLTVSAWAYTTSGNSQIIASKGSAGAYSWFIRIQLGLNARFGITTGGGATTITTTGNQVVSGQWNHIVGVWDAATMSIYVNGALAIGPTAKTGTLSNTTAETRIGITTDGVLPMVGRIDDVRIYSRAFSTSEIAALYAGNKSSGSGTYTLGSALDVNGNLNVISGTLDTSSSDITVAGNVNFQGDFTKGTRTFTLDGTTAQTISGSTVFYNLTKTVSAANTLFFERNSRQYASGALTLRGTAGNVLSLRSTRSGSASYLLLDGDAGSQTIDYLNVKDNNASGGSTLVCYLNSEGCVDSGNNTNWTLANQTLSIAGKVFTDEGTTNIGAGKTVAVSLNGGAAAGTDTTDGGGEYIVTGLTMTGGTVITLYIDGATEDAVTVTLGSGSNMTGMHLYQNRLIVRSDSGSVALTNTHLAVADNNADADISAIYSVTDTVLNVKSGKTLFIWAGDTFTPGGNVNSGSGVTIAGTFSPGSSTVTLSGAWLLRSGATFTPSTSTIQLDGTNQSLSGSTTFYNLTKTVTSATTLWMAATTTQTISNTLTLQGAASNLLSLRSSIAGVQWRMNAQGNQNIEYLDVKDSNATGPTMTCFISSQGCANSGNNTNWNFGGTIAGKVYADEGTTNIGAGKTVAVSMNGGTAAGTDSTDGGGEYVITGLPLMTGGTIITLYIDGATEKAVTVTLGSGSNMTGISLYQNHLIVRSDSGSVALTNSHLAVADNNGDSDINALYAMGSSNTILQVKPDKELWVWTGDTFTPGERVQSHDVEVKGTLTMETNGLTVTGSLVTNAGTFTTSTGIVVGSTASSAEALSMGTNAAQTLTINNGLVSYWKLDEGTGNKAVDSSGNGNVGTLTNMTTGLTGIGGPSGWTGSVTNKTKFYNPFALKFDGSNDELLASRAMTNIDNWALAAWIKPADLPQNSAMVVYNGNDAGGYGFSVGGNDTSNSKLYGLFGTIAWIDSGYTFASANTWYHVVMLRDRGRTRFYVDGTQTPNTSSATPNAPNAFFGIGHEPGDPGRYFNGAIDDVRVYNRALSVPEVSTLYAGNRSTGSGTYSLGANLDVNGDLNVISSALDTGTSDITVAGNVSFQGDFTKGTRTFTLDGTTVQTISGSTVFYNLTKTVSATNTLFFERNSRQSASGALTLRGAASNLLSLRSTRSGSASYLLLDADAGSQAIDYLNVKDNNASGGSMLLCSAASEGCTNAGNNTNWGFGVTGTGTIKGVVFNDLNGNGLRGATETSGFSGVTVTVTGTSMTGGAISLSRQTNLYGQFAFSGTIVSNSAGYTVAVTFATLPAGSIRTRFNSSGSNVLGTGATINVLFGYVAQSSLSGAVYIDTNKNGTQDGGETSGINSVTMSLSGTSATGGSVVGTTTTSGFGGYSFTGLPPSSLYTVTASGVPAGYSPVTSNSTGAAISVGGTVKQGLSLGYFWYGTMSGVLFIDDNANGVLNAGETNRFSGATITVSGTTATGAALSITRRTTSTGAFVFANTPMSSGNYTVTLTVPTSYQITSSNNVSRAVTAGANAPSTSFGIKYVAGTGTVKGTIWNDANGNGLKGATEASGLNNIQVTLTGSTITGALLSLRTTTDSLGRYFFSGTVVSGVSGYRVSASGAQIPPAGYSRTTVIASGSVIVGTGGLKIFNVGVVQHSTLSGAIFFDTNANGRKDSGETTGISGAAVTLAGTSGTGGAVAGSTTSNGSGIFAFAGLPPSSLYTITSSGLASGYRATNGTSTGVTTVTSGGSSVQNAHIGYFWYGTMSGVLFIDTNLNGVRDGGETSAYSGATVTVSGLTATGASLSITRRTTSTGAFVFANTPTSNTNYTVTLTVPTNYKLTTSNDVSRTLSVGTNAPSTSFGIVFVTGTGVIKGTIWNDVNGNALKGATETIGFSGIQMTMTGTTITGATVVRRTTTDSLGRYFFSGSLLSNSSGYFITASGAQVPPSGYLRTTRALTGGIVLGTGGVKIFNVGNVQQSSLSGAIFVDTNDNGRKDGGETTGLSGATLTLSGTSGTGGVVAGSKTSNASGVYSFLELPTSSLLTVTASGIAGNYHATNGTSTGVTAITAGGTNVQSAHIGYFWYGTLSGVVFIDTNANGLRDAGETGAYSGATISISGTTSSGGSISASRLSTSTGAFVFLSTPMTSGTYTVTLAVPTNYKITTSNGVSRALTAGVHAPSTTFGITFVTGTGVVKGTLWNDVNGNGVKGATEATGFSNIQVTMTGATMTGASVVRSTTTDSLGRYFFSGAIVSNSSGYRVSASGAQVPPAGYLKTTATVSGSVIVGTGSVKIFNVGFVRTSTLTGSVFVDTDEDGVHDSDETQVFSGVVLILTGTSATGGSISLTTQSNANGIYSFTGLPPGSYLVAASPPTGYETTSTNSRSVTISTGGTAHNEYFGYVVTSSQSSSSSSSSSSSTPAAPSGGGSGGCRGSCGTTIIVIKEPDTPSLPLPPPPPSVQPPQETVPPPPPPPPVQQPQTQPVPEETEPYVTPEVIVIETEEGVVIRMAAGLEADTPKNVPGYLPLLVEVSTTANTIGSAAKQSAGTLRDMPEYIGYVGKTLLDDKSAAPTEIVLPPAPQYRTALKREGGKVIIAELKMQIYDAEGDVLPNTRVVLFSAPKPAVTDAEGIATFNDVPVGDHTLEIHTEDTLVEVRRVSIQAAVEPTDVRPVINVRVPVVQVLVDSPRAAASAAPSQVMNALPFILVTLFNVVLLSGFAWRFRKLAPLLKEIASRRGPPLPR